MNIAEMRINALRVAIQANQVSFPAQTPCLNLTRADIQWRLVQLYFLRGWNCEQLARRYDLTRQRIEQLLAQWVDRASTLGYLQEIPAPVEISSLWQAIPVFAAEPKTLAAGAALGFRPPDYAVESQPAEGFGAVTAVELSVS